MKTYIITIIALSLSLTINAQGNFAPTAKPVAASVLNINMNHLNGTWFEISRLPNAVDSDLQNVSISFETKDKVVKRSVTGYKENGRKVNVSGKLNYHGSGTFTGTDGGVYMVLSVSNDYQHILMGTPDHKYLWVMSRTAEMSNDTYNRLIAKASDLNYNVADVQMVSHK
ncbi:MAG: lipocalin family protein [Sphingobacteriales bacterium JAD_PAG50586_3]|nr:MAG: lipocalin family protein [Sphingobacteriales bacterium JAD_PAG50586_3]